MAIIYTYPTKATPADDDLILISDSESINPVNQTKKITVASIKALTAGVTKIVAGTNIGISPVTGVGDVTINSSFTDTTIDTENDGVSVANPTTSLDFSTGLTATGGAGGSVGINFSGGLNDLSNVSYAGTNDSSMYIGNGAPSGLVGTPTKTTAVGEGAGNGTTSGSSNTLIGTNAGIAVTQGSTNVLIGADSGDTLTLGAGNVILGSGADSNANNSNAAIAIGKSTVVSTGSVAIGESASATGGGIALGRGATNTVANLALGSASYPLLNTTDTGDVNGLATGQTPAKFIEVQIGATKYYMALYAQA